MSARTSTSTNIGPLSAATQRRASSLRFWGNFLAWWTIISGAFSCISVVYLPAGILFIMSGNYMKQAGFAIERFAGTGDVGDFEEHVEARLNGYFAMFSSIAVMFWMFVLFFVLYIAFFGGLLALFALVGLGAAAQGG